MRRAKWRCPLCHRNCITETNRIGHMDGHEQAWRQVLALVDQLVTQGAVMPGAPHRVLSSGQAGYVLGIKAGTIQYYARTGQIPFDLTPGGHRRYDASEIRAALRVTGRAA